MSNLNKPYFSSVFQGGILKCISGFAEKWDQILFGLVFLGSLYFVVHRSLTVVAYYVRVHSGGGPVLFLIFGWWKKVSKRQ